MTDEGFEAVVDLAEAAGAEILRLYSAGAGAASAKSDGSPVTAADTAAEAVILAGLAQLAPGAVVVAEEDVAAAGVAPAVQDAFWLVDPLDGTREYLARNGEFTVNIAHVVGGVPVAGVVHAPVAGLSWWGCAKGAFRRGADRVARPIRARPAPSAGLVVAASRAHGDRARLDAYLARFTVAERRSIGSSLKFCRIAEGTLDLYPRFGPTMEWDTAAGDAVLRAAGGAVIDADTGGPLRYGKPDHRNGPFIAHGAWPLPALP